MKLDHFLHYIQIKWIKDLNMRHKTIKYLEENIGNDFLNIGLSNIFLDMSPQDITKTKAKINYWDYTKIRDFCTG